MMAESQKYRKFMAIHSHRFPISSYNISFLYKYKKIQKCNNGIGFKLQTLYILIGMNSPKITVVPPLFPNKENIFFETLPEDGVCAKACPWPN